MTFFKRLSDSIWDYVSPRKATHAPRQSPRRVDEWKVKSPSRQALSGSAKRKLLHTPELGAGRRSKQPRIEVEDVDYDASEPEEGRLDSSTQDEHDDGSSFLRTPSRRFQTRSPPPSIGEYLRDDESLSADLRVDDEQFNNTPPRQRVVHIPAELHHKHIGTEELRAKGWDDDYITLMQKIGLRGREAVLPAYMKFEYRFLPDGLFDIKDDAFVGSLRHGYFRASKAFEKLLDLGGHIHDRKIMNPDEARAELQVKRHIRHYVQWAESDAALDRDAAIPIMVQVYAAAGTPGDTIKAMAEEKCRALVRKWKKAFKVARSVEFSPTSHASESSLLSYELPTFYALLASDAIVAIMAYRIDTDECEPMALFDYNHKDYDFWNSLALAILVCHVRNVQIRIAHDTDIGLKPPPHSGASEGATDEDA